MKLLLTGFGFLLFAVSPAFGTSFEVSALQTPFEFVPLNPNADPLLHQSSPYCSFGCGLFFVITDLTGALTFTFSANLTLAGKEYQPYVNAVAICSESPCSGGPQWTVPNFRNPASGVLVIDVNGQSETLPFRYMQVGFVPEPASWLLFGSGLAAVGLRTTSWRRRFKQP